MLKPITYPRTAKGFFLSSDIYKYIGLHSGLGMHLVASTSVHHHERTTLPQDSSIHIKISITRDLTTDPSSSFLLPHPPITILFERSKPRLPVCTKTEHFLYNRAFHNRECLNVANVYRFAMKKVLLFSVCAVSIYPAYFRASSTIMQA